ncbi:MAG TPA: hypothetical protein VF884_02485 [Nitrososphaeraceae archaeon]
MTDNEYIEIRHKALLFAATVALKCFLMSVVASAVFCGGIDPDTLFRHCYNNVAYVGASVAAIAVMGSIFGYYVVRLKSFDKIFARMIKADFIVTAMYFGAAFTLPAVIASKVMIWLFGVWILGMLLAPFDTERTVLKKITEYGSIVVLGILLGIQFFPRFEDIQQSSTLGILVSSILSIFGSGRQK